MAQTTNLGTVRDFVGVLRNQAASHCCQSLACPAAWARALAAAEGHSPATALGAWGLAAARPASRERREALSPQSDRLGAPTKACICIGAGPVMPIPNAIPWGASEPLGRVRHSTSDPRHHHRHRHELHGGAAGSTQPLEPCAPGMHPRHVMRRLYPSTTARVEVAAWASFTRLHEQTQISAQPGF